MNDVSSMNKLTYVKCKTQGASADVYNHATITAIPQGKHWFCHHTHSLTIPSVFL